MDNLKLYNKLKTPPNDAIRTIPGGKLKGFSDINPQWRIEVLTEVFGACGVGWKYEIVDAFSQAVGDGQILVFVHINFYFKEAGEWSEAIPAFGGDFVVEKNKHGLVPNDEAYKMALTDALGVAVKMIGVAADVYRGVLDKKIRADSKYQKEQQEQPLDKPLTEKSAKDLSKMGKASLKGLLNAPAMAQYHEEARARLLEMGESI